MVTKNELREQLTKALLDLSNQEVLLDFYREAMTLLVQNTVLASNRASHYQKRCLQLREKLDQNNEKLMGARLTAKLLLQHNKATQEIEKSLRLGAP